MSRNRRTFLALSIGLLCAIITVLLLGQHAAEVAQAGTKAPTKTSATSAPTRVSTETATATSQATEPVSTIAPGPRDVQIHLDSAHSVSQILKAPGGTLQTTATNGTKYTLTFASQSVLRDTKMTMPPFDSATTIDGESIPALGVQLEPDGLVLGKAATLLIEPSNPIPLERQTSISYHKNGQSIHRYPLDNDPKKISFSLIHFSGDGIFLLGDVGALVTPPATAPPRSAISSIRRPLCHSTELKKRLPNFRQPVAKGRLAKIRPKRNCNGFLRLGSNRLKP